MKLYAVCIEDEKSNETNDILFEDYEWVCLDLGLIKHRKDTYGNNFPDIAERWSEYLEKNITVKDVCELMALLKESRMSKRGEFDSQQDLVNYRWIGDNYENYIAL